MQIRMDVSFFCISEATASSASALKIMYCSAYAQRSWRAGRSSPDDEGIMLGLYSGSSDRKRVRKKDGEAGDGWVKRARPYHSL